MTINSITGYPISQLRATFERLTGSTNTDATTTSGTSSVTSTTDTNQLSPFARILSSLQQLQQSDPSKYQQVTAAIATNLKTAADTATANGNTAGAQALTQLSNDFQNASTSGQLPSVTDLAKAVHHGGHHHHHTAASTNSDSQQALSQFLSTLNAGSTPTDSSTDPTSIILNTLDQAGLSSSTTS